jgi:flagellar M-ring protein FliF
MEQLAKLRQTTAGLGFAKLGAMAAIAAAVLFGVFWVATHAQGPMGLLYSGLDLAEAGRIGQKLDELKVPYQAQGDGSVLLVPRDQVAHVRMELAAGGLPNQSGTGYELLDQQSPMNMTSFMQRVQRTRAMEGELARTIVALDGVRTARVHIVMPERDTFARDAASPTASIAVVMNGPMRLSPSQAAAIRLLVAGAVPGLQREAVSVLDPSGIVLGAESADMPAGDHLAQVAASREQALQLAVTSLLEPLVGRGRVRVSASVAINTAREVSQVVKYDPLSQVERSKQTQNDQERTDDSHQKPAVSVAQNLPTPQQPPAPDPSSGQTSSSNSHNGQTVNFEINTTHEDTVREPGDTRRISVAVLVDGMTDAKGIWQPTSREQLDRIAGLAKAAVGYDAKRGDVVTVDTMRFVSAEAEGGSADRPAEPPAYWAWAAPFGAVILLLLGGFVIALLIRRRPTLEPVAVSALQAPDGTPTALSVVPSTALELKALVEQPLAAIAGPLSGLLELIDARPDESLAVLRAWIADAA